MTAPLLQTVIPCFMIYLLTDQYSIFLTHNHFPVFAKIQVQSKSANEHLDNFHFQV